MRGKATKKKKCIVRQWQIVVPVSHCNICYIYIYTYIKPSSTLTHLWRGEANYEQTRCGESVSQTDSGGGDSARHPSYRESK